MPWFAHGVPLALVAFNAAWLPLFADRAAVVRAGARARGQALLARPFDETARAAAHCRRRRPFPVAGAHRTTGRTPGRSAAGRRRHCRTARPAAAAAAGRAAAAAGAGCTRTHQPLLRAGAGPVRCAGAAGTARPAARGSGRAGTHRHGSARPAERVRAGAAGAVPERSAGHRAGRPDRRDRPHPDAFHRRARRLAAPAPEPARQGVSAATRCRRQRRHAAADTGRRRPAAPGRREHRGDGAGAGRAAAPLGAGRRAAPALLRRRADAARRHGRHDAVRLGAGRSRTPAAAADAAVLRRQLGTPRLLGREPHRLGQRRQRVSAAPVRHAARTRRVDPAAAERGRPGPGRQADHRHGLHAVRRARVFRPGGQRARWCGKRLARRRVARCQPAARRRRGLGPRRHTGPRRAVRGRARHQCRRRERACRRARRAARRCRREDAEDHRTGQRPQQGSDLGRTDRHARAASQRRRPGRARERSRRRAEPGIPARADRPVPAAPVGAEAEPGDTLRGVAGADADRRPGQRHRDA